RNSGPGPDRGTQRSRGRWRSPVASAPRRPPSSRAGIRPASPVAHKRCGRGDVSPRRRSPRLSLATTGRSSRRSKRGPCQARRTSRSDDAAVGMSSASPAIASAQPLTQDGPTQDGPTQDGPTQDGPTQDGPTQDGPTQDGPTQDYHNWYGLGVPVALRLDRA